MTRYVAAISGKVEVVFGGAGIVISNNHQIAGYQILLGADSSANLWPSRANPDFPWVSKLLRKAMECALVRNEIWKIAEGSFTVPACQMAPDSDIAHIPNLPERDKGGMLFPMTQQDIPPCRYISLSACLRYASMTVLISVILKTLKILKSFRNQQKWRRIFYGCLYNS